MPDRLVVRLLAVLATAAGCLDVICVTRLGGPFASVITGNLVQVGQALVTVDRSLLVHTTTAIGGYTLGVAVGTVPLRGVRSGWRRRSTRLAAVEAVLLSAVAVGWLAAGARPGHVGALLLLGAASTATGIQSVLTISSGIRGASTTYLTGTLTGVVRTVVGDPHRFAAGAGGVARLGALLGGAVLDALLLRVAPLGAPALAAALVVAVVLVAGLRSRHRPAGTDAVRTCRAGRSAKPADGG
ncbi:YoaK family protein [Plantactinospora sonchi]|uniref:YoaK family protein n=1 Tax=Plantactinospora sonchi TaxID=1544735 RepID=A0ABU7RQI0_9ACTN